MDFSALKTSDIQTLHLKHPVTFEPLYTDSDPETGKRPDDAEGPGNPITISGHGQDSKKYRSIQASQMRAIANIKNPKKRQAAASDFTKQGHELLVGIVTGFNGIIIDGEILPFSMENVNYLFEEWGWAKEQFDEFVHGRENFLQQK